MSIKLLLDNMNRYFGDYIHADGVSEVSVNKPQEVFVAHQGKHGMTRYDVPSLTYDNLRTLVDLIATSSHQVCNEKNPLLSANLAIDEQQMYRIQCAVPAVVQEGHVALSIRKPSLLNRPYDDYKGMLNVLKKAREQEDLLDLYNNKDYFEFLAQAVKCKLNIVISAGTDSGKTTLFNSLIGLVRMDDRIITIEDARELRPPQENVLQLYYSRGGQGVNKVTPQDLLEACLRLRPNRIFPGELRGAEAFTFLQVIASGHPGAITTIHANSAESALDRLALMVLQNQTTLTTEQVKAFVVANVDVIVQLARTDEGGYACSEVYYKGAA